MAMLAAFGAESLIYQEERGRKTSLWQKKAKCLLIFCLIFVLIFIAIYAWVIISPLGFKEVLGRTYLAGLHSEGWLQRAYTVFKAKYIRSLAFAFFSVVIIFLMLSSKLKVGLKLLLAFCCIILDVLPLGMEINPTVSKDEFYYEPQAAQLLKQDNGYFRFYRAQRPKLVRLNPLDPSIKWTYYWDKEVLTRFFAVLYKLSYGFDLNIDRLTSASYLKFMNYGNNAPTALKLRFMGLGNIKYILSFEYINDPNLFLMAEIFTGSNVTLKVYQNLLCMPRAYLAEKGVRVNGDDEALKIMLQPKFNPKKMVLISGKGDKLENLSEDDNEIGTCSIISNQPNEVVIEAKVERNCYLILTDSFYPGWQVTIDGIRGKILRGNVLFRAVRLTEGKHNIIFRYRPGLFYLGLLISLISLISIIGVSLVKIRRELSAKNERIIKDN